MVAKTGRLSNRPNKVQLRSKSRLNNSNIFRIPIWWVFAIVVSISICLTSVCIRYIAHNADVHTMAPLPLTDSNTAISSEDANHPSNVHTTTHNNEWEGWQPHPPPSNLNCNFRQCLRTQQRVSNDCTLFCRDSPNDLLDHPPTTPIPPHWIPDVRVLHRMATHGTDIRGNPWPPELPSELCEPIGPSGGNADENLRGLRESRILNNVRPLLLPSSSSVVGLPTVLCLVYTMESSHPTNLRAIRETWASGCDGFLAFSTKSDPRFPAVSIPHDGPESYRNMWQKVRSIWRFVGQHYVEEFDYFVLGGEDLFLLPGNLKRYLGDVVGKRDGKGPEDDLFMGRRFKAGGKDNYFNSGGAGYVLSRGLVRKFVGEGLDDSLCNPTRETSMEDVMIANCLRRKFGVGLTDTRDEKGRERFHPFAPGTHLNWKHPIPPKTDWYENYNTEWGLLLGADSMAPDSVSFHYVKKPTMMRHFHKLLYSCGDATKLATEQESGN